MAMTQVLRAKASTPQLEELLLSDLKIVGRVAFARAPKGGRRSEGRHVLQA